jgi:DNA-binding IclR family transcriptional regulator
MPRKAAHPSVADEQATPGGAAAVDRAVSVLAAFRSGDAALSVTELAGRTRLYKSTVLRLLASLAQGRLVQRTPQGQWVLGPEVARLAGVYSASFSLEAVVLPVMRELMAQTRESVAFHVRQGEQRVVLFRVDSPQLLRDHVQAGDVLPLDRGAGGRVLLAFSGTPGRLYDLVRQQGHALLSSDRVPGLVGVSAPVWNARQELVGALTLTAPETRVQPAFTPALMQAAARITGLLGGTPPAGEEAGGLANP